MNSLTSKSSTIKLIASQGLNAFGDHLAKIVASALVAATFSERQASVWVGVISFLYIAPYIVFAPLAGRLTRRFSKQAIVKTSLLVQAATMAILAVSAALESFVGVMFSLAIVGVQSCFLAPARNSLLKDYAGVQKMGQVMGIMALVGVAATLAGLALGGWSFDYLWSNLDDVWLATSIIGIAAFGLATLAFVVVVRIEPSATDLDKGNEVFRDVFRELVSRPAMRWSSLGLAWFYGVGAMLVMLLLQDGRWDHGQSVGAASQGGIMAALLGLGVAAGSGIAALLCRRQVEVGLSFLGALGIMLFSPFTALFWNSEVLSVVGIVLVGISGGLFAAPLNALFITLARDEVRSSSLAANNLVINVVTTGFIGLGALLSYHQWSPVAQLLVIASSSIVVVVWMSYLVPESLLRLVVLSIVKLVYPAKLKGVENMPQEGGVLIVANHVSYVDAFLIYASSPRPVRFIGTDAMLRFPWMRWVYRRFNVIAVSPTRAKEAVKKTVSALQEGSVVCVFPEGALTRTGMHMPFKKGAELMARLAKVPVLPACIDGMWGSMFSFADKPFRYRSGMPMRRRVCIRFAEPIFADEVSTPHLQQVVVELGNKSFSERAALKENLGFSVLKALSRKPFEKRFVDKGPSGSRLSSMQLAAISLQFARLVKRESNALRVGILLPPGVVGFASNIGALWVSRSTVNLNPTVSRDSFRAMIRESGIEVVFTSRTLLNRFPNLPLDSVKVVYVEDLRSELQNWTSVLAALAFAFLPVPLLARIFGISRNGGDREATLLFSSGSSAEPKGIPLSHRNLVSNVAQLSECYLMKSKDSILSNLPLFHSFGLTGGLLLPLLKGMKIVATPSPLNVRENVEAVRSESVNVILGTPTFLKPYLIKADSADFQSVRLTIAGAEKLPTTLQNRWTARFGSPILEGYGLTECSPVVAANCMQSSDMLLDGGLLQSGGKKGSVGRPLPGVWIRIVFENDFSKERGQGEAGLILIKGPNVFSGYLDATLNGDRFTADGWMNTGDIGSLDEDGFLKIEGRLSRFSKIAGEMVSHQSVELAIERAYPECVSDSGPFVVVASRPSEKKGEELVALTRSFLDSKELAQRLRDLGVPNLWIPQAVLQVTDIPCLATGKVDLKRCIALCVA